MDPEIPHPREIVEFAVAVALVVVLCVIVAARLSGPMRSRSEIPGSEPGVVVQTAG